MTYSIKTILKLSLLTLIMMSAGACSDDLTLPGDDNPEQSFSGALSFRCSSMLEVYKGPGNIASRSSASKDADEKRINTLHVFFFDIDGNLLTPSYDNFKAYQKHTGTPLIKIPEGGNLFKKSSGEFYNDDIIVAAIANIDATDEADSPTDEANAFITEDGKGIVGGKICKAGRSKSDENEEDFVIRTLKDLESWVYYPRMRMSTEDGMGDITVLPEAGMPMIGVDTVNLSTKPAQTPIINLRALMAKVNVSVELDPYQSTKDFPYLEITEYGVMNMPVAVPFTPHTGNYIKGDRRPTTVDKYLENYDVTKEPVFHIGTIPDLLETCNPAEHEFTHKLAQTEVVDKDNPSRVFTYYTYENINVPNYSATLTNGDLVFPEVNSDSPVPVYRPGIDSLYQKQRWKPTIAYKTRASALILKGNYTNHQGLTYKAQFTVYLGSSDSETDFMVKRNHQYDNNIVIHGLDYIRNSDDDAYTFDGRVNVVDDNPFYLAIVNERKVDAHATALPMDVWFMMRENGDGSIIENPEWDSKIKFTIRDHENKNGDWIRMEKIPRSVMEAGGFKFGTGARDYFTTDLVTSTLKNNGVTDGKEHGYEITVDGKDDGSRSRIYFYIDENVPTDNYGTDYGDRKAVIDVEYTRKDNDGTVVDHRVRTLEIEQRALLKVDGTWTGNDGATATIPDTWMEYYEEYLEHNDPLDKHEQPGELYTGLPWGLSGTSVYNFGGNNPDVGGGWSARYYRVYYKAGAWAMIQWMFNQGIPSLNTIKLFNDSTPSSAFHYCYGKNKRNPNGTAAVSGNKGWYLPGIRELEKALVYYYGTFSDFRGNLYWSSSAAQETQGLTGFGQPGNYARATSVSVSGNKTTYAQSDEGEDGYNLRTKVNRIRAFYRVN
ncbi:MAG: hypothetical protein K2I89_02135 [Muribaculaceae bacterium]|nr:hypothetical protein [Muribaculaceae bacterium]